MISLVVSLVISIIIIVYIASEAAQYNRSPLGWGIFAFFFGFLALGIFLYITGRKGWGIFWIVIFAIGEGTALTHGQLML